MVHRRGNPNWGKPTPLISRSVMVTEFEKQVRQLRLTESNCAGSDELRVWCKRNKNRCYVPEWLLEHWKMSVDFRTTD